MEKISLNLEQIRDLIANIESEISELEADKALSQSLYVKMLNAEEEDDEEELPRRRRRRRITAQKVASVSPKREKRDIIGSNNMKKQERAGKTLKTMNPSTLYAPQILDSDKEYKGFQPDENDEEFASRYAFILKTLRNYDRLMTAEEFVDIIADDFAGQEKLKPTTLQSAVQQTLWYMVSTKQELRKKYVPKERKEYYGLSEWFNNPNTPKMQYALKPPRNGRERRV